MITLFIAHIFYVFVGYVIAVLFPLPWLSSAVLAFWSAFGSKIVSFFKGAETDVTDIIDPTTVTPVVAPVVAPVVVTTDPTTPAA